MFLLYLDVRDYCKVQSTVPEHKCKKRITVVLLQRNKAFVYYAVFSFLSADRSISHVRDIERMRRNIKKTKICVWK